MARRVAPQIEMFSVAERPEIVDLANGLGVLADYGYADAPVADALIITGGPRLATAIRDGSHA